MSLKAAPPPPDPDSSIQLRECPFPSPFRRKASPHIHKRPSLFLWIGKDASHFDLDSIRPMQTPTIYCVSLSLQTQHDFSLTENSSHRILPFLVFSQFFTILFVCDAVVTSSLTTWNQSLVTFGWHPHFLLWMLVTKVTSIVSSLLNR